MKPNSKRPSPTPDYGLDAPGAVRNLFIAAAVGRIHAEPVPSEPVTLSSPGPLV